MEGIKRWTEILVVGSGGNGVAASIELKEAGVNDFTIITKQSDFGGTWFQNTYPGCEVDVPSYLYQIRRATSDYWQSIFAKQPEILEHLKGVARKYELYDHAVFDSELLKARWSDEEKGWQAVTTKGTIRSRFLLLATGYLEEAVIPDIPGAHRFTGRMFHSSHWPEGYRGTGDKIAIVGTGSSGIQILTSMSNVAENVTIFQRTPTWVLPKGNKPIDSEEERDRFRRAVADSVRFSGSVYEDDFEMRDTLWHKIFLSTDLEPYEQMAMEFLDKEVPDPEVKEKLRPSHRLGCKRPLFSDGYYAALQKPNVELVASAVEEVRPDSVRACDGTTIEADTIVLATGFIFGGTILGRIERRDGNTVLESQEGHLRAYKSVSTAQCPNLFLAGGSGPNGQIWHGMYAGELVATYLLRCREYMIKQDIGALQVDERAEKMWKAGADRILDRGPNVSGGCVNYSLDPSGHNKAVYPGTMRQMYGDLSRFDACDYNEVDMK